MNFLRTSFIATCLVFFCITCAWSIPIPTISRSGFSKNENIILTFSPLDNITHIESNLSNTTIKLQDNLVEEIEIGKCDKPGIYEIKLFSQNQETLKYVLNIIIWLDGDTCHATMVYNPSYNAVPIKTITITDEQEKDFDNFVKTFDLDLFMQALTEKGIPNNIGKLASTTVVCTTVIFIPGIGQTGCILLVTESTLSILKESLPKYQDLINAKLKNEGKNLTIDLSLLTTILDASTNALSLSSIVFGGSTQLTKLYKLFMYNKDKAFEIASLYSKDKKTNQALGYMREGNQILLDLSSLLITLGTR